MLPCKCAQDYLQLNPTHYELYVIFKGQSGCRAFGGGRTIRQGEALETEEAAQARKKRIAEALSRYRTSSGHIVDSSVEAACQVGQLQI